MKSSHGNLEFKHVFFTVIFLALCIASIEEGAERGVFSYPPLYS